MALCPSQKLWPCPCTKYTSFRKKLPTAVLESAVGRSWPISIKEYCQTRGSNWRPSVCQADAHPSKLPGPAICCIEKVIHTAVYVNKFNLKICNPLDQTLLGTPDISSRNHKHKWNASENKQFERYMHMHDVLFIMRKLKMDIISSSWDYGTYHKGDQQRLRQAWTSAQSRQSLRCSHTWSREVDEGSDQK